MKIDTAKRIMDRFFRKYKDDPYTHDPVARALYETWKQADSDTKRQNLQKNCKNERSTSETER